MSEEQSPYEPLELAFPEQPVTLEEMIWCVRRELEFRRRVYARRVKQGKMKASVGAREIRRMEAVLAFLVEHYWDATDPLKEEESDE